MRDRTERASRKANGNLLVFVASRITICLLVGGRASNQRLLLGAARETPVLEGVRPPAFFSGARPPGLFALHLGMWRSAAASLKVRPQCGHLTSELSTLLGITGMSFSDLPSFRAFVTWEEGTRKA